MSPNTAVLESIDRIVAEGQDADEVLRAVVEALVSEGAAAWAGIFFAESGELVLGPEAGTPDPGSRTSVPVTYDGSSVAELAADGGADRELLERVAELVVLHCLVGWDTGGVPWDETDA